MRSTIEPRNKFFAANRSIVEYEIHSSRTVSFMHEVDLTEVEALRADARRAGLARSSYTAFVAKAVALALPDFPYANRRVCRRWLPWPGVRLQRFTHCDIAIAAEREVPGAEMCAMVDVMRDVDRMSLAQINAWLHALATSDESNNEQWRAFRTVIERLPGVLAAWLIRLPYFIPRLWVRYRGGAVLISSPAKYGVDAVVATWTSPIGISFGLVKQRPVVRGTQVVACPTFMLTMNFDRRVMAGAQAARFFRRIVAILEHARSEMAPFLSEVNGVETRAATEEIGAA
jgi:pyruvate/2-oxoglutarate dehydrogenase complex dihydrolipoamide acyltransferase (E2) component